MMVQAFNFMTLSYAREMHR